MNEVIDWGKVIDRYDMLLLSDIKVLLILSGEDSGVADLIVRCKSSRLTIKRALTILLGLGFINLVGHGRYTLKRENLPFLKLELVGVD